MICEPETNKRAPSTAGFTIVETLIVLAVGSVFLLIVLLAVPGLQRSSRNNERRQDVQDILQFVSHYELNNSGDMPTTAQFQSSNAKITFYVPGSVSVQSIVSANAPGHGPHANSGDTDSVVVYNYQKCTATGDGTDTAAGYTDIVALYAVESTGAAVAQCQQL